MRSFYFFTETVRNMLHEQYREKPTAEQRISIKAAIENHNESSLSSLDGALTMDDHNALCEHVAKDTLYFADYEVVDGYVQRIKYEPFTCEFVTTGKVVIENDLREFFTDCDFNVNATVGTIRTMKHYAEQKMLHGFVGNSCPGLYLNREQGLIHIGADYDQETDETILPAGFDPESIAWVCTDLWWYSIVDLEVLKERVPGFKEKDPEKWSEGGLTVVEIPAGTWKLTHKYGVSETGYHENLPYATLQLVK